MDSIDAAYSPDRFVKNTLQGLIEQAASNEFQLVGAFEPGSSTKFELEAPAVVKLTQHVLQQALQARATAIHVEPGREHGRIRYRVDGVLQHYLDLPLQAQQRIVLRLRNVAESEQDAADGARGRRIDFQAGGGSYELRVQFAPTPGRRESRAPSRGASGPLPTQEALVARHRSGQDPGSSKAPRWNLAHRGTHEVWGRPTLLYLGTQPPQHGPSSTSPPLRIHSTWSFRESLQTQFDPTQWASFADALQNLLNQDPDVIYAGEIRDLATARVVVRASITGRLVIATVHTADAVTAVRRLLDLGLDAGRVVESVRGVVSQRLLRRLCPHCAEVVKTAKDVPAREAPAGGGAGYPPDEVRRGMRGVWWHGLQGPAPCAGGAS